MKKLLVGQICILNIPFGACLVLRHSNSAGAQEISHKCSNRKKIVFHPLDFLSGIFLHPVRKHEWIVIERNKKKRGKTMHEKMSANSKKLIIWKLLPCSPSYVCSRQEKWKLIFRVNEKSFAKDEELKFNKIKWNVLNLWFSLRGNKLDLKRLLLPPQHRFNFWRKS